MHQTSVRFGEQTWAQLKALAEREGVPTSQIIREGTIAHMAMLAERERSSRQAQEIADLRRRVEALERRRRL